MTHQRQAIIDVLTSRGRPLTARLLHEKAQDSVPSIGVATVYRNLRVLVEAELVEELHLTVGRFYTMHRNGNRLPMLYKPDAEELVPLKQFELSLDDVKLPKGMKANDFEIIIHSTG